MLLVKYHNLRPLVAPLQKSFITRNGWNWTNCQGTQTLHWPVKYLLPAEIYTSIYHIGLIPTNFSIKDIFAIDVKAFSYNLIFLKARIYSSRLFTYCNEIFQLNDMVPKILNSTDQFNQLVSTQRIWDRSWISAAQ